MKICIHIAIWVSFLTNNLFAQDLIRLRVLSPKEGYVNPASSTLDHIKSAGVDYGLREYISVINILDTTEFYFTINQQADLIYFEKYSDTSYKKMVCSGYYRQIYESSEMGYLWVSDLVWLYFNSEGLLKEKRFYNKGKLMKSPTLIGSKHVD